MNPFFRGTGLLGALLLSAATVATYKKTEAVQLGNPGLAMEEIQTRTELAAKSEANVVPAPLPAASHDGQLAVDAYKNVQVLGHLSSGEFTRLMTAMTLWVAPNNGCAYCHAPQRDAKGEIVRDEDGSPQADLNKLWSDELYAKRVARRMLQMTMHINGDWKQHVQKTGVTCYTCHRGILCLPIFGSTSQIRTILKERWGTEPVKTRRRRSPASRLCLAARFVRFLLERTTFECSRPKRSTAGIGRRSRRPSGRTAS